MILRNSESSDHGLLGCVPWLIRNEDRIFFVKSMIFPKPNRGPLPQEPSREPQVPMEHGHHWEH